MRTVADLGRAYKLKKAPRLNHLSDEDAGRQLKSEYPGKYTQYQDVGIAVRNSAEMTTTVPLQLINYDLENKIQTLIDRHNPHMGIFVSWWRKKKVQGQNNYLEESLKQQDMMVTNVVRVAREIIEGRRREAELQSYLTQNQYWVLELQARGKLLVEATAVGMNVDDYSDWNRFEKEFQLREKALQDDHYRKLQSDAEAQRLASLTYTQRANVDTDNEVKLAYEKLRFQIIAERLTDQQIIGFIQDMIDDQFIKIAQVEESAAKRLIPVSAKDNIVQSRQRIIQMYMEQQNETQHKILGSRNA